MMNAWPIVPLSKVIRQRKEFIEINDLEIYKRCRVQLHAQGIVLRDEVPGAEIKTKRQQVCRAGEFLVAEIDAKVGGFGIVPQALEGSIVSGHYFLFEVDASLLDRGFLDYFIRTPAFRDQVNAQGSTNYAAIRSDDVLRYEIPLPSLDEQRHIIARIEALAAKIEEARELRQRSMEEAEILTSKLGNQIFADLRFKVAPLSEVAIKKTGMAYRSEDFSETEGVPVVRLKEIITKTPSVFLSNPERYSNVWLEPNDIILAKTSFSTGSMCIWPGPKAVLNQNAIMLRAKDSVDQRFLFQWLGYQVSVFLQHQLADPNFYPYIREKDLMAWNVPLPPLEEQRRIVAYLDGLQAKVDALKQLQSQTRAEIDALLPSVLDRAFKGEL